MDFWRPIMAHREGLMKAVVLHQPGPPANLKIEWRPIPKPNKGQLLIKVKAFGLNRSELFTRLGYSPNVRLPRILGIEAVGIVAACPGGEFGEGQIVATCMGGLGREVDGGYAEYTLVKAEYGRILHVASANSPPPDWKILGALPEMLQTSWGALNRTLKIQRGDTLLIRGGTTSVGLAAAAIAKQAGCTVLSTTRKPGREKLLKDTGVDEVIIDTGSIAEQIKSKYPQGVPKVLELVGNTLADSASCVAKNGTLCQVGVVGGNSDLSRIRHSLPAGATYEFYGGEQDDFHAMPLLELVGKVLDGTMAVQVGKVYHIDEIAEAHRVMESNSAGGKIVVLTST